MKKGLTHLKALASLAGILGRQCLFCLKPIPATRIICESRECFFKRAAAYAVDYRQDVFAKPLGE